MGAKTFPCDRDDYYSYTRVLVFPPHNCHPFETAATGLWEWREYQFLARRHENADFRPLDGLNLGVAIHQWLLGGRQRPFSA